MTGLANRRHMYEHMQGAIQQVKRVQQPLSLLLIDIDNFKLVNDSFGHQFGDDVLVRVAHTLRHTLRNHDSIARWGGEEFLVLLADTDNEAAKTVAEKLRSTIEEMSVQFNGAQIPLTISIGMHTADPEESLDVMLNRADENLYTAKNSGRNRIVNSSQYT